MQDQLEITEVQLRASDLISAIRHTSNAVRILQAHYPEIIQVTPRSRWIVEQVRARPCGGLPYSAYEENALAFNQAFFIRNLFKVQLVIAAFQEQLANFKDFIDVGSGAGAAAFAWSSHMPTSRGILVDRSRAQLSIASTLCKALVPGGNLSFLFADVLQCRRCITPVGPHVVLLSYWLCDQTRETFYRVARLLKHLTAEAVIVIDYEVSIQRTAVFLPQPRLALIRETVEVPMSLRHVIRQPSITLSAGLYHDG